MSANAASTSPRPSPQSSEAGRAVIWALLSHLELPGTVESRSLAGNVFLESDMAIFHSQLEGPESTVFAGKAPHNLTKSEPVAFRLEPGWRPTREGEKPVAQPRSVRRITAEERQELLRSLDLSLISGILDPDRLLTEAHNQKLAYEARLAAVESEASEMLAHAVAEAEALRGRALAAIEEESERLGVARAQLEMDLRQFRTDVAEFNARGGDRFAEAIRTASAADAPAQLPTTQPPSDLLTQLESAALADGLGWGPVVLRRAVTAHLLSAALGHLVVYGGPPGSGKSTLAGWLGEKLGFDSRMIPVRPGWLDAVDLLGYFDPRDQRFVPTTFLDALTAAAEQERSGRMGLAVLDEMNLARIENYAPDLLSLLERSRSSAVGSRISLYATSIRAEADRALLRAIERNDEEEIASARDRVLRLTTVPPDLRLPPNFTLAGTLNDDETTHQLSPKVIDRALAVRVPAARAADAALHLTSEAGPRSPVWIATRSFFESLIQTAEADHDVAAQLWSVAVDLVDGDASRLAHLSHRTARTVALAPAVARVLNIEPAVVLDDIMAMKVLPWLKFPRRRTDLLDELQELRHRSADAGLIGMSEEIESLVDAGDEVVQYLR